MWGIGGDDVGLIQSTKASNSSHQVYSSEDMKLLDKKALKLPGIKLFEWYTPETLKPQILNPQLILTIPNLIISLSFAIINNQNIV